MSLRPCELGQDFEVAPAEDFLSYLSEVDALSQLIIGRDSLAWGAGFHVSDLTVTLQHLSWIQKTFSLGKATCVNWFCEWGAGLGGVSACASHLGFNAFGFEVDSRLVRQAKRLFGKYALDVQILEGSFLPDDAEIRRASESFRSLETSKGSAWGKAPVPAEQVAVYYAYPWPGEESWFYHVFEQVASPGALLFCFHGAGEYSLWEKVA